VPPPAGAGGDTRLPVGVTLDEVEAALRRELGAIDGVTWSVIEKHPPAFTGPHHAIVRHTVAAATEILGRAPVVNMRVGASDARLYRMFGVPSVVFGCTPFGMGGPDEYILVDELVRVAQVHALAALAFLSDAEEGTT